MNTQVSQSIESFDVMEFLKRYLQRSSRLNTMYRDYQEFQNIKMRAEALSKSLEDNERGCSLEELDTVAEVITGNPSHQSVINKAKELADSAKQAFVPHVKAMLKEYKDVLDEAKSYFFMLIPSAKTTTTDNIKITNFVNEYPKLDYSVKEDMIECGCIIEVGHKSVAASFEEFDAALHDFCGRINSTMEQINSVIALEEQDFMDQHSRVVKNIPFMEDSCVQLMKYRELLKSFLEGNRDSLAK